MNLLTCILSPAQSISLMQGIGNKPTCGGVASDSGLEVACWPRSAWSGVAGGWAAGGEENSLGLSVMRMAACFGYDGWRPVGDGSDGGAALPGSPEKKALFNTS